MWKAAGRSSDDTIGRFSSRLLAHQSLVASSISRQGGMDGLFFFLCVVVPCPSSEFGMASTFHGMFVQPWLVCSGAAAHGQRHHLRPLLQPHLDRLRRVICREGSTAVEKSDQNSNRAWPADQQSRLVGEEQINSFEIRRLVRAMNRSHGADGEGIIMRVLTWREY